jgi:hypothetical protein
MVAGCSFGASPADGLAFRPPPGWRSSPGIMGFMQFWRPPSSDREVLMLFKSPRPIATKDFFNSEGVRDSLKNISEEERSQITICNNQPALYIKARGTSSRGGDESVEMIGTNAGGNSYFAMYVRPLGAAPNRFAETALRQVCTKS